jgi:hypothetical protein
MVARGAYSVVIEGQEIVVRLKAGVLDREAVIKFLDFLELESIRQRSRLTADDAAGMAQEIDASVWSNLQGAVEQK